VRLQPSIAVVVVALVLVALPVAGQPEIPPHAVPQALLRTHAASLVSPRLLARRPFVGAELDQDVILRYLGAARPVRFKPVGSTSIVYEMVLDGPINAAFKPASRHRPGGAVAEVAAYRIARLLGMDNVPPAVMRTIRRDDIQSRLHPDFADDWDEIADWTIWDENGACSGAAIYWVPEMRSLGLERDSRMRRWSRRLRQEVARIDPDEQALHGDLSRLLVLDYLVGNWDRWSGGNAQGLPDGTRLITRDHDMSFTSPLSANLHARVFDHLRRTEKFPRDFVQKLLQMNEAALRTELARDPGAPAGLTLDDTQIAGVMDRRQAVISYVVALIDEYGEERVLSLP